MPLAGAHQRAPSAAPARNATFSPAALPSAAKRAPGRAAARHEPSFKVVMCLMPLAGAHQRAPSAAPARNATFPPRSSPVRRQASARPRRGLGLRSLQPCFWRSPERARARRGQLEIQLPRPPRQSPGRRQVSTCRWPCFASGFQLLASIRSLPDDHTSCFARNTISERNWARLRFGTQFGSVHTRAGTPRSCVSASPPDRRRVHTNSVGVGGADQMRLPHREAQTRRFSRATAPN
jgi:hypothetical protein